ncbi:pfs domain-containing protein [Colletotrichum kahawae]|uniref:Pfs domain-containing protein n=1 Tax=Colletotrichum kahawae TaxID=34407 RepID=A0AAD9YAX5_COLKA|nr:pfs domain-containing protein [Colletotrichum kahawae]
MSSSEKRINARDRFHLLQSVHPFFCRYLPTIEDVGNGRYGGLPEADLANDITILRSDIKSLPFKLRQIDIDQVMSDTDLDRLIGAFDSVLHLFEDSVLEGMTGEGTRPLEDADCVALFCIFPKLVTLRSWRQPPDTKPVDEDANCAEDAETSAADNKRSAKPDSTVLFEKQSDLSRSYYVNLPPPQKTVEMCRGIVERFGKDVAEVFPDDARGWNSESLQDDITDAEIDYIREARAFSKISSSLFSLLVDCITCQADHVARLHLFGFHKRQMEMLLGTGEQGWISMCFTQSLPEDIAALGVLVLELEANLEAEWTKDDEDYETAIKLHRARLYRILKEWKGELPDRYHSVGSACFRFEKLVEDFDHPEIDQGLRDLAILYKCIVNPLFRQLVSDFGDAERLFQGIPGLSVPVRQKRASEELMGTLDDGFLWDIRALRRNSSPIGLAETVRGERTPENIRIALLDTGIDTDDRMIKSAMKKNIVETRSWVGESCHDTYGHGTHVARLLIKMAPSAQIFIAKITDNKNVDPKDMWRIAEAIDWAVKKCNVDIISMSFGFEDENDAIDEAIERAFKADKLMFVAASNEGGNKKRSRLGRSSSVICIHACDGKGNKGLMSPNPLKRKENFTTLGVAVKSQWKKNTVYKSGTSFATPVAAAIAANVLEFANFRCNLSPKHRKLLYSRCGMVKVFEAMSEERDGYDYVQPGHLWDGKKEDELAKGIRDILAQ